MTEERKELIAKMQKVIDCNPRKEIFAAILANIAEDYEAQKQAKNNEVLDLVIDCCKQIDNLMLTTKWGIRICKECGSLVNTTGR